MSEVVLGTVQLGLSYGRRAGLPAMTTVETDAILDAAWSAGIRAFDTARAYGNAVEVLADHLTRRGRMEDAHVVMKLTPDEAQDPARVVSLASFSEAASLVLLSHTAAEGAVWSTIQEIARAHDISPGQSVYTASDVSRAAAQGATLVQAPANVLDLRCVDAASDARVPIDVRSVFLQGVLLDTPEQAAARFPGAVAIARGVRHAADVTGVDPAAALIGSVAAALGDSGRLVLGVDHPDQLAVAFEDRPPAAQLAAFDEALAPVRSLTESDPRMLDPRVWPTLGTQPNTDTGSA